MKILRSLAFQGAYYLVSAFYAVMSLPLLLLPGKRLIVGWVRLYARTMVAMMKWIGGIQVAVRGRHHLPDGPFIIAAKHQSWGDGFTMLSEVSNLTFVTGDHLTNYPIIGSILKKLGAVVVNNCGGTAARGRLMAAEFQRACDEGRRILIYPEGHLSEVGKYHRYRKGVFHLYQQYGCPVVPVATDLGLRWPQQNVMLNPGPCTTEFLEPIPPGLEKEEFMTVLKARIEDQSRNLIEEQRVAGTLPFDVPMETTLQEPKQKKPLAQA